MNLKLTIDLLPRGAWGTNLSRTLPQKDWDKIREAVYAKANHACAICKSTKEQLEAHEIWDFDIASKTQTLVDIVALCKSCHFVKHLRHAKMIGLDKHAKEHFMRVNKCDLKTLATHYMLADSLFTERNKIDKWQMNTQALEKLHKGVI